MRQRLSCTILKSLKVKIWYDHLYTSTHCDEALVSSMDQLKVPRLSGPAQVQCLCWTSFFFPVSPDFFKDTQHFGNQLVQKILFSFVKIVFSLYMQQNKL